MTNPVTPPHYIGRKISRIRELRGINQDTLAIKLGTSQQTVSKMEQSETIDDEKLVEIENMPFRWATPDELNEIKLDRRFSTAIGEKSIEVRHYE